MSYGKEHYAWMGLNDARDVHGGGKLPERGLGAAGAPKASWQAKAYWDAYWAEYKRLEAAQGPSTGRISSSAANIQSPKPRTAAGQLIARAFVGYTLHRGSPVLIVSGPVYPQRTKGRSKRGWTTAAA